MRSLVALAALAVLPAVSFRQSRPIETPGGWTRVEIPLEVFDACRPGLPDLRVLDAEGREVPYAWEPPATPPEKTVPLHNLESVPHRETVAEVDRGERAGLAAAVTLEIPGAEFLKPVVVEASPDGSAWKEVARGSVFASGEARRLTLRLPAANERRYWRFRLDDRNSDPVRPISASFAPWGGKPLPERTIALAPRPAASGAASVSLWSAPLPAANLPLSSLRIDASDPAYSRPVRILERVYFRGQVTRRLLGEGVLLRSPGGREEDRVAVCIPSGRNLEIEIENGEAPPLSITRLEAAISRPSILFFASQGASLRLAYDSPAAAAPSYDLGAAISRGSPPAIREGGLGPASESGSPVSALAPIPRGGGLDPGDWKTRRPILLPPGEGVAYLDLDDPDGESASLRIVDPENRQVPFLFEDQPVPERREARLSTSLEKNRTVATLGPIDRRLAVDAVELAAGAPDYFSRDVTILEPLRDERGPAGTRTLGEALWEKRPEEKPRPIRIPISRPSGDTLRVEIDNGDNAPIRVSSAAILFNRRRIDFVYRPGDAFALLSGNPEARPPKYDLQLLAGRILSAPAEPARLGPAREARTKAALPGWFWAAVTISGVLVALALSRTLKRPG